jgi:hypothetical protein
MSDNDAKSEVDALFEKLGRIGRSIDKALDEVMSKQARQDGVAQTILDRLEDRYKGALPHNVDRFDGQLHGAAMMHEALSAEARNVRNDKSMPDDVNQYLRVISDGEENPFQRRLFVDLEWFCQRLGLDIDQEES